MIRTIIIPEQQDVSIHIPENYIGKQIEVLLYAVDELTQSTVAPNKHKAFRGALKLTEQEHTDLQQHLHQIRGEWNRDI